MSLKAGETYYMQWALPQTELLAPTDQDYICPVDGFIETLGSTVETAVTTGGTIDVKTGAALAVTVAGLQQTIADAATKGTRQRTTATAGSSTRAISAGDRICISPSAPFATAGALRGYLAIRTADTSTALPAAT